MKKREASFGILFRHWIKANPMFSCALEDKQSTTNSIPFSCLAQAQIDWAMAISSDKGALIRVIGSSGEPDYIWCRNMPAYVVIRFPREFHLISIGTFVLEKERSKRKSLTTERAKEISTRTVKLKADVGI